MKFVAKFLTCLSFVTCLPLGPGSSDAVDPAAQDDASSGDEGSGNIESLSGLSAYLPAVGLFIGGILCAQLAILQSLRAADCLAAVSLWLSWLLLTGGIHFDGLLDTADGVFSHRSRPRMLAIMRDSRSGNFAIIAALAVVLLKCSALLILFQHGAWPIVLLVPAWSRWCETYTIGAFDYARPSGMGKIWHDTASFPTDVVIAAALPAIATISVAILLHSWLPVGSALVCIACGLGAAQFVQWLLGAQTGDTYGFVVEVAEAGGVFLTALALH